MINRKLLNRIFYRLVIFALMGFTNSGIAGRSLDSVGQRIVLRGPNCLDLREEVDGLSNQFIHIVGGQGLSQSQRSAESYGYPIRELSRILNKPLSR